MISQSEREELEALRIRFAKLQAREKASARFQTRLMGGGVIGLFFIAILGHVMPDTPLRMRLSLLVTLVCMGIGISWGYLKRIATWMGKT